MQTINALSPLNRSRFQMKLTTCNTFYLCTVKSE